MHNQAGKRSIDCKVTMQAHDRLPLDARVALNYAVFDYDVLPIVWKWEFQKRGYRDGKEIAKSIAKADEVQIKLDTLEVWGICRS
jgi:hypothetical protein